MRVQITCGQGTRAGRTRPDGSQPPGAFAQSIPPRRGRVSLPHIHPKPPCKVPCRPTPSKLPLPPSPTAATPSAACRNSPRPGLAVFVPCALPGETVRVRLVEEKRGHARAELLEVLTPSPDRVTPRCPHFLFNPKSAIYNLQFLMRWLPLPAPGLSLPNWLLKLPSCGNSSNASAV